MTSAEDVALEFFTHHPTHIERAADEVEARNAAVVALAALILRERKEADARAEAAEAESARLREALTVAETLYGGLMADDARALIRAALNP